MSSIDILSTALQKQLTTMKTMGAKELFTVNTSTVDLWQHYLSSFPEGTNPIMKERTKYDCNCCKQFIRDVGNVVAIINGKVVSIWDITVDDVTFQSLADNMAKWIKQHQIDNVFRHTTARVGTKRSYCQVADKPSTFHHLSVELPSSVVVGRSVSVGSVLGEYRDNQSVLKRTLEEINIDAVNIVSDLIAENYLERGGQFSAIVTTLKQVLTQYNTFTDPLDKELFVLETSIRLGTSGRIKNTAIGTLLVDLSSGVPLDRAVQSFEFKVAGTSYRRSSAPTTAAMNKRCMEEVERLGLSNLAQRRFAVDEDLTVNNVLFVNRDVAPKLKGTTPSFGDLKPTAAAKRPNTDKVQDVSIADFISNILPNIDSMEVFVTRALTSQMVSLIAPIHSDDTSQLFTWNNNYSWSYIGENADSIKERVKRAGGNGDGDVRCSVAWFNYDDLDLQCREPSGNLIKFSNKRSVSTKGVLDVDMNAGWGNTRTPVENITWADKSTMKPGDYLIQVNQFSRRESGGVGFEYEQEIDGVVTNYQYNERVTGVIDVVTLHCDDQHRVTIKQVHIGTASPRSTTVWGIETEQFHPVKMMMLSPNFWDDQTVGHKHWFFMLKDCATPDPARGFYNEFLGGTLVQHRKVLEQASSQMKITPSGDQLSGLGFSSTRRTEMLCRVSGSFNRTINIKF